MSHRLENALTVNAPTSGLAGDVCASGKAAQPASTPASARAPARPLAQALSESFSVQIAAIFGLYLILRRLLLPWIGPLPEGVYGQSAILAAAAAHPTFIIAAGTACLVPFIAWKRLGWRQFESGQALRWTFLLISLAPAYAFATYDYNYYFDQWHTADRVIVAVLALLVAWHPAFVMPLVVASVMIAGQFYHPMHDFSWSDKHMPFDVMILFAAFLHARLFLKISSARLLVLILCGLGASYLTPLLTKVRLSPTGLEWLLYDELANLLVSARLHGWLAWMSPEHFDALVGIVHKLNPLLLWGTFAIEAGALFLLFGRRRCIGLLIAFCALHLGILLCSGIFFWKWIVVDVAIAGFLLFARRDTVKEIFTRQHRLASLAVIPLAVAVCQPPQLGWFDTPFSNVYRFRLITDNGHEYGLSGTDFAPYDLPMSQNRFHYLSDDPVLVTTFGATMDWNLCKELENARSADDIARLKETSGWTVKDKHRTECLDRFLRRYLRNMNRTGEKPRVFGPLSAPYHINNSTTDEPYNFQAPIARLRILYTEALYTNGHVHILEDRVLRDIEIPPRQMTTSE